MTPRRLLAGALALAALAAGAATARAQVPTRPPASPTPRRGAPVPPDSLQRARGDTLRARRDTGTVSDTAARANLVAPDTVMQRLLALPGYDARQYQGETITFDALTRGICLANRATVASGDSLLIKSQSICSQGAGNQIRVGSDTTRGRNVIGLPGQKPIYSTGVGVYDVAGRRAVVTEVRTSLEQSGELLAIRGERVVAVLPPRDSTGAGQDATFYLRDGTITACTDSVPDYYFKAGEIKRTGTFVVARPAVLYIGDVPVMWLPFLFQDVRGGRHSGILAPNVGVSDIVRNSPSYRRSIEGLGYYVAISDYLDAQAYLDWRSSAGESEFGDVGWMRYNAEVRYNWIDRFVTGRAAIAQTNQAGLRNTAYSLDHRQQFSRNSSLAAQFNYVTNTVLQRQTSLNPYQVSSSIRSSANYANKFGPFSLSLGATQTQSPGRPQLDRTFPTLNLSSSALALGDWLVWTPSLTYNATQRLHIDQPTNLGLFLQPGKTASSLDTLYADTLRRNLYSSSLSFGTPLQIFGYTIGNQFSVSSQSAQFPQLELVRDVRTGAEESRIYTSTFDSRLDWTPSFTLPPLARNNFNLTPQLSLENIDPGPYAVRNHRTNGEWVRQGKRPTFGLSASPTLFGLFGGFGPYTRIRHTLSPTVSYSYAPARDVSDDYLRATAQSRFNSTTGDTTGYLGGLARNQISLGLSTVIEAKTRSRNDSNPEAGDKIKLASITFSSVGYDFERARVTGKAIRGLTTDRFNYTVRSDLLPGFDLSVDYSLFQGSTLSDSAVFSPYREGVSANFTFSPTANPFAVFTRLFGRAVPETQPNRNVPSPPPDQRFEQQAASQPVAGRSASRAQFMQTTTPGGGWQASFHFTAQRRRPVTGANVVADDPAVRCAAQYPGPRLRQFYEQCLIQERAHPSPENLLNSGLPGATVITYPNTTSLSTDLRFNLTEHWAASYNTQYDFEQRSFAQQVVSLQRDLHDWRATFGFTQSVNGSFNFLFNISLKAEPELKFDYHKATVRGVGY